MPAVGDLGTDKTANFQGVGGKMRVMFGKEFTT